MNILKLLISFSLVCLLLFGLTLKTFFTIDYLLNKAEITELFCVNKEKPKLQCNGKCHLTQELKKIESTNEEKPLLPLNNNVNLELIFILVENNINFQNISNLLSRNNTPYFNIKSSYIKAIVIPPPQQFV